MKKRTLFELCTVFLSQMGAKTGVSYKEISVYVNLYTQGIVLILMSLAALISSIVSGNVLILIVSGCECVVWLTLFTILIRRYHLPKNIDYAFDKCVEDLFFLARQWRLSYQQVNVLIFIIAYLILISANVVLIIL